MEVYKDLKSPENKDSLHDKVGHVAKVTLLCLLKIRSPVPLISICTPELAQGTFGYAL